MSFVKYTDISNDDNISYGSIIPEFRIYSGKITAGNISFTDAYAKARYLNGIIYMIGFLTGGFELVVGIMATRLVILYDGYMLPYNADLYTNAKIIMSLVLTSGVISIACFMLSLSRGIMWVFIFAQVVASIAPIFAVIFNYIEYYKLNNEKISSWNNVDTQFISVVRFVGGPVAVGVGSIIIIGIIAILLAYIRARRSC